MQSKNYAFLLLAIVLILRASSVYSENPIRVGILHSLGGTMAAWNYFMSIDSAENQRFIDDWQAYVGRMAADGQYQVIWQSLENIPCAAWSKYLPSPAQGATNR